MIAPFVCKTCASNADNNRGHMYLLRLLLRFLHLRVFVSRSFFRGSSRGTGVRRSTRRVEPHVVAHRRNNECRRVDTTYFQTSSPSLSNTTSTSSEDIGGERVWCREGLCCGQETTSAACPRRSLRYASLSEVCSACNIRQGPICLAMLHSL